MPLPEATTAARSPWDIPYQLCHHPKAKWALLSSQSNPGLKDTKAHPAITTREGVGTPQCLMPLKNEGPRVLPRGG